MKVTITDAMRGTYAADGSIEKWPYHSVIGRPYERRDATLQRLTSTEFVVIPPGQAEQLEIEHPLTGEVIGGAAPIRVSPSGVVTGTDMEPIIPPPETLTPAEPVITAGRPLIVTTEAHIAPEPGILLTDESISTDIDTSRRRGSRA